MSEGYYRNDEIMSVGQWIGVLLILGIPIVGVIMYLVWAFSDTTNENLRNFCKASLLITLIVFSIAILLGGCSALLFSNMRF